MSGGLNAGHNHSSPNGEGITLRPLKNPAIFTIPKKTTDFFEVTGGRVLKRPTQGDLELKKSLSSLDQRGVLQRSHFVYPVALWFIFNNVEL
jgi:hypothetical protein